MAMGGTATLCYIANGTGPWAPFDGIMCNGGSARDFRLWYAYGPQ